jgi:hypothetical protein
VNYVKQDTKMEEDKRVQQYKDRKGKDIEENMSNN